MIVRNTRELGPGEARDRQRRRNQIIFLVVAGAIGGGIGFVTGFFDQGDGSLFSGDWDQLKLPPALALVIVVMLLIGLVALPLYGFRMVDDYKREQSLVAFAGGCLSVLAGFPVWAALYGGGFAPAPHAFGVFAIAYVSMLGSYAFARWRL